MDRGSWAKSELAEPFRSLDVRFHTLRAICDTKRAYIRG